MSRFLPERIDIDDPGTAGSVTLATEAALADIKSGRDRRAFMRHGQSDLQWVRVARLRFGQGVSLVDLSTGGASLDSPVALGPNSVSALEIIGAGLDAVVPFRVLRCEVADVTAHGLIYRGACEFIRPLELPDRARLLAQAASSGAVFDLDVALKTLIARVGVPGDPGRLSAVDALQALTALQMRAANLFSDPMGARLTALLRLVVPALEQRRGLAAVIGGIDTELRRVVPHARVRFAGAAASGVDPGVNAVLIGVPGVGGPLVTIDVPKSARLTAWQLRVLKTTSRLIVLMQQLEPNRPQTVVIAQRRQLPVQSPSVQPIVAETAEKQTADMTPLDLRGAQPDATTGLQKVVVRYTEGQCLKGYTEDFLASRPHFTLWSGPSPTEGGAVIVPVLRLKAVFFVRDFSGNPEYIERNDIGEPQRGRRIEVTLSDDEVIVGTTLNYRSDSRGFFVTPIDPLGNNIRVFVVANAVRHVRFPSAGQRATG